MSRDSIRAKILGVSRKSKVVEVDGIQIEVRQPSVGEMMSLTASDDKKQDLMIHSIVENCYVPGTNERVFDETDIDGLRAMPFGDSWLLLTKALDELMDYKKQVQEEAKNLPGTQDGKSS